ncbi:hypothetical protein Pcaca04_18750 [Pectobacterium carotovorum subsp. carotovorum]|nr:hypothetical protein Pcaca04_18750 [Pectobacterium carotovorum subsp. carotovorum]
MFLSEASSVLNDDIVVQHKEKGFPLGGQAARDGKGRRLEIRFVSIAKEEIGWEAMGKFL